MNCFTWAGENKTIPFSLPGKEQPRPNRRAAPKSGLFSPSSAPHGFAARKPRSDSRKCCRSVIFHHPAQRLLREKATQKLSRIRHVRCPTCRQASCWPSPLTGRSVDGVTGEIPPKTTGLWGTDRPASSPTALRSRCGSAKRSHLCCTGSTPHG